MEKRNIFKAGDKPTNCKPNETKTPKTSSVPSVSKVSKATWSKVAKQVLQENIGAWKTLAKE
jgi:hypothetical protein